MPFYPLAFTLASPISILTRSCFPCFFCCSLFKKWDDDKSGKIDRKEFAQAVRALGFDVDDDEAGAVFDSLDDDGSGELEYAELNTMLRKNVHGDAVKRRLARAKDVRDDSRGAKHTLKNSNKNYAGAKLAALPDMVKLSADSGVSIAEQLAEIMAENSVKLIDLFREWDEDGDGHVDKKEFRKAVAALGYDVPNKDLDAVFATLDVSGDGAVDYNEMKKALNAMILEKSKKYAEKRKLEQKEANKKLRAEKAAAAAKMPPKAVALAIPAEEAPGEIVVNAFSKHTHTVIMLHSFRGKAEMYARLYRRFGPLAAGFKFVFPRAPERTIMRAGEEAVVTGWYDPTKRYSSDGSLQPVNSEQLGLQTKRMHSILEREAALLGGDFSKLVLGGSHQGGALAIHAAMTARASVGCLICSRTVPLAPSITPVAAPGGSPTKIFVFAAEKDAVHPVANAKQAYQQFSNAGYTVEWHTEPDLSHSADSPNEQRFVAYWVARECLGPEQGKILKGVIPVMVQKRAAEKAATAKRQRAQSAGPSPRSDATSPRGDAETGFVHALYREPDYRWLPQNGPSWDSTAASGFMAPFSPIFAEPNALLKRIDRGGPMLGRELRTPSPRGSRPASANATGMTQPDLLGDARYELVTTAPRNPSISPPPTRPGTAYTARPAWNDDVSLKPGPGTGIFVSRPNSARSAKQSPRGTLSPRARPKSAVNPLHMAVMAADAEIAARPQSSPGLPRGQGPRTKRMNTRAPAMVGTWTNDP